MHGNSDELARVARVASLIDELIPHFCEQGACDLNAYDRAMHLREGDREKRFEFALLEALGEQAELHLIDYYVYPIAAIDESDPQSVFGREIGLEVVRQWLSGNASAYSARKLAERVAAMLRDVRGGEIQPKPSVQASDEWKVLQHSFKGWFKPGLEECAKVLATQPVDSELLEFACELLSGRFDVPTPQFKDHHTSCRLRAQECSTLLGAAREWLAEAGKYDLEFFSQSVNTWGRSCVPDDWMGEGRRPREGKFHAVAVPLARTYAMQLIDALPETAEMLLKDLGLSFSRGMQGQQWLSAGMTTIERLGVKVEVLRKDDPLATCIRRLLDIVAWDPADASLDASDCLRRFDRNTLLAALPYAGIARESILRQLGWEAGLALHRAFFELAGTAFHNFGELCYSDIPNSDDPQKGVFERAKLAAIIDSVPTDIREQYFGCFKRSALGVKNTLAVFEALLGSNRKELTKSVVTRNAQAATKAFGLLPVESEQELMERYLILQKCFKDASQYGSERQANVQAAVQAALENLAQSANFPDVTRLEWKLESKLAGRATQLGDWEQLGDWSVRLCIENDKLPIEITKAGKYLKSVPAAVRKAPAYLRRKEQAALLRAQTTRFRRTFETMMCCAECIANEDIADLWTLPLVKPMLERLIFIDELTGAIGHLQSDPWRLLKADGSFVEVRGALRIAHSYDLWRADVLSLWQARTIKERITQPFKQAFRELYVVTPAEERTDPVSNRFAGHAVKGAVASRLLQSRGWRLESGDEPYVYKFLPEAQITARFAFSDAGHFLSESESVLTDSIFFLSERGRLPLREVPTLIFSEVMRDVDLVVSVARLEGDAGHSGEMMQSRQALLALLAKELSLEGVHVEGNFVHVKGKLAAYRVHLGSGAVHIEPGNYLCIVSADAGPENFFLPFADADRKTSEIVSKVLLLMEDEKISDASILRQIRRTTESATP